MGITYWCLILQEKVCPRPNLNFISRIVNQELNSLYYVIGKIKSCSRVSNRVSFKNTQRHIGKHPSESTSLRKTAKSEIIKDLKGINEMARINMLLQMYIAIPVTGLAMIYNGFLLICTSEAHSFEQVGEGRTT